MTAAIRGEDDSRLIVFASMHGKADRCLELTDAAVDRPFSPAPDAAVPAQAADKMIFRGAFRRRRIDNAVRRSYIKNGCILFLQPVFTGENNEV